MTGEELREARIKRGMTQVQLARLCDTSQPFISAIENGVKPVGDIMAARLRAAFETTFDDDSPYHQQREMLRVRLRARIEGLNILAAQLEESLTQVRKVRAQLLDDYKALESLPL